MKKLLTIVIFLSLLSCEQDILDDRPSGSLNLAEAIVDLNTLNLAANGHYSLFANSDIYNRTVMLLPDVMSDNAFIDAFDNTGRYLDYDNYTVNDRDGNAEGLWNDLSRIVVSTSLSIRKAEEINFSEDAAQQYMGELYAQRALAYFIFQQFFAQPYNFTADASHLGVPMPDVATLGDAENLQTPPRSTTKAVYDQIVNDLTTSIGLLGSSSNEARIDVHAARALLARVYLNMERWSDAADLAENVIDNSGASLLSRNNYVSAWANDFTSESLFSLVNNDTDNSGTNSIGYFYIVYEDAFATDDFISIFEADDIRLGLYDIGNPTIVNKYPDGRLDNIPVLRLSEMYLIAAEAHARLNTPSDDDKARDYLDEIIQRADETAEDSDESGQSLIDKIILERRKELAYEGFRLLDLARMGSPFTKFRQDNSPISMMAPDNFTILPIPQSEINVNPNLTGQQNPGY